MKIFTKTVVASALGSCLAAGQSVPPNFINHIEMIEFGQGGSAPVLWNVPGEVLRKGDDFQVEQAVPDAGALFVLSTIQQEPFRDFFLDQATVGTITPEAKITINSHDSGGSIPRVRADQPFTVSFKLDLPSSAGIEGDASKAQAATKVEFARFARSIPEGESSLPSGALAGPADEVFTFNGVGTHGNSVNGGARRTILNPTDPFQARGEEHFVVRTPALGAGSGSIPSTSLDQAHIEVWPVWKGTQTGLTSPQFIPYNPAGGPAPYTNNRMGPLPSAAFTSAGGNFVVYGATPPPVTFTWKDLFPNSTVAVMVNEADKPYPWGGVVVPGSVFNVGSGGLKNHSHTVDNWSKLFGARGDYAVWMITETPGIGWEVGGNISANGDQIFGGWPFRIMRNEISIRGSIHSFSN